MFTMGQHLFHTQSSFRKPASSLLNIQKHTASLDKEICLSKV